MVVLRILLSLFLALVATGATAADNTPADNNEKASPATVSNDAKLSGGVYSGLDLTAETRSRTLTNDDVCYTIRTYKVKRTERLTDRQRSLRGYATCEMAGNYRLRSADASVLQPEQK
jgi:hypothetical protein